MISEFTRLFPAPALVLSLPRNVKRALVVATDICLCILSTFFAFWLLWGELVSFDWSHALAALISLCVALPIFFYFDLYQAVFRFSGPAVIASIAKAILIYGLIYLAIFMFTEMDGVPATIGIIQPMLLFFNVVASRWCVTVWLDSSLRSRKQRDNKKNAVIYGAGAGGRQLLRALMFEGKTNVLGFLDDDIQLIGQKVDMISVFPPANLAGLISEKAVNQVFLAIPSLKRGDRKAILEWLSSFGIDIKFLPSVAELPDGSVTCDDVKEIDIEDLLGRTSVEPDVDLLRAKVTTKVVMVSGAGGSIGGQLAREIVELNPAILLLLDDNEYALYTIHEDLVSFLGGSTDRSTTQIVPLLGSVRDSSRMRQIISTWSIETIYHAAAYKHVPIVENNPVEAVKNNVFGTLILAEAAIEFEVSDFVLISTDKAVRPTNVMGATKRLAEMVLQSIQEDRGNQGITRFSMVRFGNVLGSSGSVIPKFRAQLKSGGPLTVTHEKITRFFMTIPEAAQLVIQASALAEGGDVFVLEMGSPIKIINLARQMIKLSGYSERTAENPDGEIQIEITGLRPGEKLYEELLLGDNSVGTTHPKIMRAREPFTPWYELVIQLDKLNRASEKNDARACFALMQELVVEFKGREHTSDWTIEQLHLEN